MDSTITFKVSVSDLVGFRWTTNGIEADFLLPDDEKRVLTVRFDRECVVRILDEMALSTEDDDTSTEGLVPEHFAYVVHGASFFQMQSKAWISCWESVAHYRFITGWACLDVISSAHPTFDVRDAISGGD